VTLELRIPLELAAMLALQHDEIAHTRLIDRWHEAGAHVADACRDALTR
jgi:hypothetical protein